MQGNKDYPSINNKSNDGKKKQRKNSTSSII